VCAKQSNYSESQARIKAWALQRAKERHVAARARQRELGDLDDATLMALHEKLCAEVGEFPKNQDRMVVEEAFWMEVDRRTFASGWFWRRWRRPDECEKWRVHVAKVLQIMLKSGRSS